MTTRLAIVLALGFGMALAIVGGEAIRRLPQNRTPPTASITEVRIIGGDGCGLHQSAHTSNVIRVEIAIYAK